MNPADQVEAMELLRRIEAPARLVRHAESVNEELLVALADERWKGARVAELEERAVEAVSRNARSTSGCRGPLHADDDDRPRVERAR